MVSLVHSTKYLNEKIIPILHKCFHKVQEGGTLLNSFYEVSITLISKPDKDITRKETVDNILHEHRHKKSLVKYE